MAEADRWNQRYRAGDVPWDTGFPSTELLRVMAELRLAPCRVLELGCGTGTNSLWLAQQGHDVTAVDLADEALQRGRAKADGLKLRFVAADVLALPDLGESFDFFFDRGCYHVVRRASASGYVTAVASRLAPGAKGLVLTGNAREPHSPGPPVVSETDLRAELGVAFDIVDLREFRFDERPGSGENYLGWSCLVRKR
jgi:SAM-dependent methyltransferase